ncbi:MAG: MAPEG family protein [Rhizobiaceae bacterium]
MSGETIFWPVLAQVALTFAIYILVSIRRVGAIKSGAAKPSDYRVPIIEPEASASAIRSLNNQFELPILFYVCCLTLHALGSVTSLALGLAWVFVFSRLAHAFVHVTSNRLKYRRPLFIVGFLVVVAMWVVVLLRLLLIG